MLLVAARSPQPCAATSSTYDRFTLFAVTDAIRLLPGLGVAPIDEVCARLLGIGYDGPCSIELFRPEYWEWDPNHLAVQAREAAIKMLAPYFDVQ